MFVVRRAPGTADEVIAAINVSAEPVDLPSLSGVDLITGRSVDRLRLDPFQYAWLRPAMDG